MLLDFFVIVIQNVIKALFMCLSFKKQKQKNLQLIIKPQNPKVEEKDYFISNSLKHTTCKVNWLQNVQ